MDWIGPAAPCSSSIRHGSRSELGVAATASLLFAEKSTCRLGGPPEVMAAMVPRWFWRPTATCKPCSTSKYKRLFAADDGRRGGPNKCTGASGKDLVIKVPCGTEVRHLTTGILLGDLTAPGERLTVAFGGRGGLGNAHYLSNRNRAPEKFTEGRDGEEWPLQLELKLLAEVGIIGLPNAGKSTLIAVLSAARPKIADYPFTTLVPNLGVVRRPSGDGTVFADIPGLIEGAAQGAGLGHDFLRHIERTRLLIHLVDAGSEDPVADLNVVQQELEAYGHGLRDRPRLLVINKQELVSEQDLPELRQDLETASGRPVLCISAAMGTNLDQLLAETWAELGV